jgi:hypothetical protein
VNAAVRGVHSPRAPPDLQSKTWGAINRAREMRNSVVVALGLALCGLSGCGKRSGGAQANGDPAAAVLAAQSGPAGFRYPPARWRLATYEQLSHATVWLGHIAIRHRYSQDGDLRPPGWQPDSPNPQRSIAEALELAQNLRARLEKAPADFEQLAREHSEDVVTKDEGGSFGGVRADQVTSELLDAYATLKPGEISQPFRTPYGFHILKRYAPPSEEQLAGERLVIGYQGVFGLVGETQRSRAQALALANNVAAEAKRAPENFSALVARYSENLDRARHGDLGVYSTRDPGVWPAEIQRLAAIETGQVTGPLDSRAGFEILRRVPVTPRKQYAMAAIELTADSPGGRDAILAETFKMAERVLRDLEADPSRFQELQQRYCCDRIERWTEGRGSPEKSAALDRLSLGELAPTPLQFGSGHLVIKRLDPSTLPPETPQLAELPSPTDPDYTALASRSDGTQLAAAARDFVRAAQASSAFSPQSMKTITETISRVAGELEQSKVDRPAALALVNGALASLEHQLGAEHFAELKAFGRRWVISRLMPPGFVE